MICHNAKKELQIQVDIIKNYALMYFADMKDIYPSYIIPSVYICIACTQLNDRLTLLRGNSSRLLHLHAHESLCLSYQSLDIRGHLP